MLNFIIEENATQGILKLLRKQTKMKDSWNLSSTTIASHLDEEVIINAINPLKMLMALH